MSAPATLGAARRAWELLWDQGRTKTKEKEKRKDSKKTINRRKKRDKQTSINPHTNYQQTQLSGANLDRNDVEYFGDEQHEKRPNIFRLGFHNIYNLPEDRRTSKSRQLLILHCSEELRLPPNG
jgi:hypothetical protein